MLSDSLKEKDQSGNWTDHVYANGKRLASIRPALVLHHTGMCGNCVGGASNYTVPALAAQLGNYTLRAGDRILFDQKQTNARAGLYLYATDGTNSMGNLRDQYGDWINSSSLADGTWHTRYVDLGSWAGKQIGTSLGVSVEANTPAGVAWDSQIANVSLVSADGTVRTMFYNQPVGGTAWSPAAGSYFGTETLNGTTAAAKASTGRGSLDGLPHSCGTLVRHAATVRQPQAALRSSRSHRRPRRSRP